MDSRGSPVYRAVSLEGQSALMTHVAPSGLPRNHSAPLAGACDPRTASFTDTLTTCRLSVSIARYTLRFSGVPLHSRAPSRGATPDLSSEISREVDALSRTAVTHHACLGSAPGPRWRDSCSTSTESRVSIPLRIAQALDHERPSRRPCRVAERLPLLRSHAAAETRSAAPAGFRHTAAGPRCGCGGGVRRGWAGSAARITEGPVALSPPGELWWSSCCAHCSY